MLELYASKGARTVLRGGSAGNSTSLPDLLESRQSCVENRGPGCPHADLLLRLDAGGFAMIERRCDLTSYGRTCRQSRSRARVFPTGSRNEPRNALRSNSLRQGRL